jgi:hypothetical protein
VGAIINSSPVVSIRKDIPWALGCDVLGVEFYIRATDKGKRKRYDDKFHAYSFMAASIAVS